MTKPVQTSFFVLLLMCLAGYQHAEAQNESMTDVIHSVQPRMVKIFGGGGLSRLESWQSGFFISDDGLIATAWSYVLDAEPAVVLDDGRRLTAQLVGYHPQFEIALLRIEVSDQAFFDLGNGGKALNGSTVLAFSNLYGVANGNEKCSVQIGVVSATIPLNARRGNRKTNYDGPVIIVDATINNPGAAGGVVTDRSGRILGLIGRESRSAVSDLWLNYAIPSEQVAQAVDLILAGQSNRSPRTNRNPSEHLTLDLTGLVLVPDVVDRTPPFVDQVLRGSAAEVAGILPDDLIVQVNGKVTASRRGLQQLLKKIDRDSTISITLQREEKFLEVSLQVKGR